MSRSADEAEVARLCAAMRRVPPEIVQRAAEGLRHGGIDRIRAYAVAEAIAHDPEFFLAILRRASECGTVEVISGPETAHPDSAC